MAAAVNAARSGGRWSSSMASAHGGSNWMPASRKMRTAGCSDGRGACHDISTSTTVRVRSLATSSARIALR